MKDIKGKEVSVGDKVVFKGGSCLTTGVVAQLRTGVRYGSEVQVVKIKLDVAETRGDSFIYEKDANGSLIRNPEYGQGTGVNPYEGMYGRYYKGTVKPNQPRVFRELKGNDSTYWLMVLGD